MRNTFQNIRLVILMYAMATLFSCDKPLGSNPENEVEEKKDGKKNRENGMLIYCDNERNLLIDSLKNWKVPTDSIRNMDDYIEKCRTQKSSEYAKVDVSTLPNVMDSIHKYGSNRDTLNQIFENVNPHPKVYPYIVIDSIEISLMQLLRSTGAGYFSYPGSSLRIHIYDKQNDGNQNWEDAVYRFFMEYSQIVEYKNYEWNRLQGPMVVLGFENEAFPMVRTVIKDIVKGYLKALRFHSEVVFEKKLCELNPLELLELKHRYPLRIRLLKQVR